GGAEPGQRHARCTDSESDKGGVASLLGTQRGAERIGDDRKQGEARQRGDQRLGQGGEQRQNGGGKGAEDEIGDTARDAGH
ncbi:hypothetical protein LTR94_037833, partial [Friedmanniomyces endolithicus]